MERRTFLTNNLEKLQRNHEAFPQAIKFTSSFFKACYNPWNIHIQWQIFVASYTGVLEGTIREHAPAHFCSRRRLLCRFPQNYITPLLQRFPRHKFLQAQEKQDLQSDPTRKKGKKNGFLQVRSSDSQLQGHVSQSRMDNGMVRRQDHQPQAQHPHNHLPWTPPCSQHPLPQLYSRYQL